MISNYPYPTAEHLEPLHTPYDVIDEELRLYPAGRDMREGIIGISRIYEHTPLLVGFKKYARLLDIAHHAINISAATELTSPSVAANFYVGEVLATHISVKPMPRAIRQYVLGQDFLYQFGHGMYDIDPDNEVLRLICNDLIEFREQTWRETLDKQDEEYQEKLFDLVIRMFDDTPDVGGAEDDVMAGYLFAANLIFISIDQSDER